MEVMAERRDGVVLIRVSGRIDGSNAAEFDSAVSAAIEDDDRDVLMDLETISYIATAGLRTFAKVARKLRGGNARLALCAMQDQSRRVLEVTGFDRVIPTFPSRTEALAFLARERSARTRDSVSERPPGSAGSVCLRQTGKPSIARMWAEGPPVDSSLICTIRFG